MEDKWKKHYRMFSYITREVSWINIWALLPEGSGHRQTCILYGFILFFKCRTCRNHYTCWRRYIVHVRMLVSDVSTALAVVIFRIESRGTVRKDQPCHLSGLLRHMCTLYYYITWARGLHWPLTTTSTHRPATCNLPRRWKKQGHFVS